MDKHLENAIKAVDGLVIHNENMRKLLDSHIELIHYCQGLEKRIHELEKEPAVFGPSNPF